MIYLEADERPFDNELAEITLEAINRDGVHGSHLEDLKEIFSANENECLVALNIANVKWNNLKNTVGQIEDAGVAILVHLYLLKPNLWPVRYTKDPDIEGVLSEYIGEKTHIPMLVGRSRHSYYRWTREKPPKDHIKILLNYLEQCAKHNKEIGLQEYNEYFEIVSGEAARRNVNILEDESWSKGNEK